MSLDRVPAPGRDEVTAFHRTLPGYAPTPLRSLSWVADEVGIGEVWLKDESDRLGMPAFKMLGASWAVAEALRRRPDPNAPAEIVAASAGNHGRAVARCSAQRGVPCRIYLPAAASRASAAAIEQDGAQLVFIEGQYDDAVAAAEDDAARTGALLIADVARTPDDLSAGWVVDGYATLFREIDQQLPSGADVLLAPTGVGSLAAAAVRWAAHNGGRCRVVAVEPTTAAGVTASLRAGRRVHVPTPGTDMAGLDCPEPSLLAWPSLHDGLFGTVLVTDDDVHAAMRGLARHGLAIGPCGAASLAALRLLAADGTADRNQCGELRDAVRLPGSTVVCLATEGVTDPDRYRAVVATPQ
jgi:diaminopropionate ammonia-lyase